MHADKESTIRRLNRIGGQVAGIGRMIEQDRYCIDVLRQLQAVKAAVTRVEAEVLKAHAASCVETAISSGDTAEQREKFAELVDLFASVRR